jgi:RNA polymerase sigma-70 factor (ECF subfamily)
MKWLARLLPAAADTSDEEAMRDVQLHADPAAFARLVRRWEDPIRRLCTRMTGDEHAGEDLSQEAFARVFARRHQFDCDRKFSTWLWRIAINLCHEHGRRSGPRLTEPLDDSIFDSTGPDEQMIERERADRVRDAIASLPESLRVVVVLREYEGLKFREIAEVLDAPEGTVKSRMTDALEKLRRKLKPVVEPEVVKERLA